MSQKILPLAPKLEARGARRAALETQIALACLLMDEAQRADLLSFVRKLKDRRPEHVRFETRSVNVD